jgi:hypothetical protein
MPNTKRKPVQPRDLRYPTPQIKTLWIVKYPSLSKSAWNYGVYTDEWMAKEVGLYPNGSLSGDKPLPVEVIQIHTNLTAEDLRRRTTEFGPIHFKTNEQMWGWAQSIAERVG